MMTLDSDLLFGPPCIHEVSMRSFNFSLCFSVLLLLCYKFETW